MIQPTPEHLAPASTAAVVPLTVRAAVAHVGDVVTETLELRTARPLNTVKTRIDDQITDFAVAERQIVAVGCVLSRVGRWDILSPPHQAQANVADKVCLDNVGVDPRRTPNAARMGFATGQAVDANIGYEPQPSLGGPVVGGPAVSRRPVQHDPGPLPVHVSVQGPDRRPAPLGMEARGCQSADCLPSEGDIPEVVDACAIGR